MILPFYVAALLKSYHVSSPILMSTSPDLAYDLVLSAHLYREAYNCKMGSTRPESVGAERYLRSFGVPLNPTAHLGGGQQISADTVSPLKIASYFLFTFFSSPFSPNHGTRLGFLVSFKKLNLTWSIKEYALVHRLYRNSAYRARGREERISAFSLARQDC